MTGGGGKEWINGETIAGMALVLMALLFFWGAAVNPIWAQVVLATYAILAIGAGFIILGVITIRRTNRAHSEEKRGDVHRY